MINVASGHESDSNLDRELLDALEGSAIGAVGLGRIKLPLILDTANVLEIWANDFRYTCLVAGKSLVHKWKFHFVAGGWSKGS